MAETPKQGEKKGELKDLNLAEGVDRIPEIWNRHGNTILIVLTIAALAYAAWNWRARSQQQAAMLASQDLIAGRDALAELQGLSLANPEFYAVQRKRVYDMGSSAILDVLSKSEDKGVLARALVLQGDLAYAVAQMPESPAVTTRPALGMSKSVEQLLTEAKNSYQAVLAQYNTEATQAVAARLGLAAIAENAGDFAVAKQQYEAVAADEQAYQIYRDAAKEKVRRLPELERPMRLRATSGPAEPLVTTRPTTEAAKP